MVVRSSLFGVTSKPRKASVDHGRTRTCNLRFRRPTPYPLGHATSCLSVTIPQLCVRGGACVTRRATRPQRSSIRPLGTHPGTHPGFSPQRSRPIGFGCSLSYILKDNDRPRIWQMLGRHLQGPVEGPMQGNLWLLASLSPWVYSSAVERLTADQQVPGSSPGAPFQSSWR